MVIPEFIRKFVGHGVIYPKETCHKPRKTPVGHAKPLSKCQVCGVTVRGRFCRMHLPRRVSMKAMSQLGK